VFFTTPMIGWAGAAGFSSIWKTCPIHSVGENVRANSSVTITTFLAAGGIVRRNRARKDRRRHRLSNRRDAVED
jgi:hypothetical protein